MRIALFAAASAALVASSASASITGAVVVSYEVTAADFGGADVTVNVQDLYMTSNDAADVMLNVYNLTLAQSRPASPTSRASPAPAGSPTTLAAPSTPPPCSRPTRS